MRRLHPHFLTFLTIVFNLVSPVHSGFVGLHVFFHHRPPNRPFSQWLEIYTLCLSPLVAHVSAGIPRTTVLFSKSEPNWISRLAHFNPLSIIWRYYAIADRRVRSIHWDKRDMAACNTVFWDGNQQRWDGSEEIMVKSRQWITKTPESDHVPIVSASSLLTIVVTLQGLQAVIQVLESAIPKAMGGLQDGLPYLFLPLSVIGLLRLPAAFWLSNNYHYSNAKGSDGDVDVYVDSTFDVVMEERVSDRLHSAKSGKGIISRVWWVVSTLGILGTFAVLSFGALGWRFGSSKRTVLTTLTLLLLTIWYLLISAGGSFIFLAYILKGRTNTTIIPCIHATWYKLFTVVLIGLAMAMIVVGSLETRSRPDGLLTTFPEIDCTPNCDRCFAVEGKLGNATLKLGAKARGC